MIVICKRHEDDPQSVTMIVEDHFSDKDLRLIGGKVLTLARDRLNLQTVYDDACPVLFGHTHEPSTEEAMDCHERYLSGDLSEQQRQAFYRWHNMPADLIERDEAELAAKGHLWQSEDEKLYFHTHKYALGIVGWAK